MTDDLFDKLKAARLAAKDAELAVHVLEKQASSHYKALEEQYANDPNMDRLVDYAYCTDLLGAFWGKYHSELMQKFGREGVRQAVARLLACAKIAGVVP